MKIDNFCGTNESIRKVCEELGVSDLVADALDNADYERIISAARGNEICLSLGMEDAATPILYTFTPGENDYKTAQKIVGIGAYEEGPNWDVAMMYIMKAVKTELEKYFTVISSTGIDLTYELNKSA